MICKKCNNKKHTKRRALMPCVVHLEDGDYHSAEVDRAAERYMDFEEIQWTEDDVYCYFCGNKMEKFQKEN